MSHFIKNIGYKIALLSINSPKMAKKDQKFFDLKLPFQGDLNYKFY